MYRSDKVSDLSHVTKILRGENGILIVSTNENPIMEIILF